MKSTRTTGAYYLKKTIDYFKAGGWKVEKFEVAIPFFIKGRAIFSRKDLLGSDLFIWNDKECFLIQVKSGEERSLSTMLSEAKRQFAEWNVPLSKKIVLWQKGKKPVIHELSPVIS